MSLRETALEEIRSAIAVGDLGEDRIFSAAGLAKTLGMSLSPVREAMMSLVSDGTVEAVPNRGYRLVPVTRADLDEILHLASPARCARGAGAVRRAGLGHRDGSAHRRGRCGRRRRG